MKQEITVHTTALTLGELLGKCFSAVEAGAQSDLPVIVRLQEQEGSVCNVGAIFEACVEARILERANPRRIEDAFILDASTYFPIDGVGRKL